MSINNLPEEVVVKILNFLSIKELFMIENVNLKWQKCVLELLAQKQTLKRLDEYSKKFQYKELSVGIKISFIDDNNIDILKSILTKCTGIQHLDLRYTILTGNNNLLAIASLCPKLQSIHLNRRSNVDVSEHEMDEFGKMIGPQLIQLDLDLKVSNIHKFMMIILKYLKDIEEINFYSKSLEDTKQYFHELNVRCNNLKILNWQNEIKNEDINDKDEDMINVMNRIEYLKICASNILQLRFPMNNLTELTLYGFLINDSSPIEMELNITKLNVIRAQKVDYDLISQMKFPKLESVSLINDKDTCFVPSSFIHQIKHIKSFEFHESSIFLRLKRFDELTNLVWKDIQFNPSLFGQYLNGLAKHKTLQNIKLEIEDNFMKIDNKFYQMVINFCEEKPNTEIVIIINDGSFEQLRNSKKFIDYKKLFVETKRLHKLNMRLILKKN